MATPSRGILLAQLRKLKATGFFTLFTGAAARHSLPVAYLCAIASRETNCTNELGDFRHGEYHGVGILQVDIQHDLARQARDSGTWKTRPAPLIEFAANLLAENLAAAEAAFPAFTPEQHLKIAASGYNEGEGTAEEWSRKGDSDRGTTGHDYGADCMARLQVFRELLG